uniref:Uncharacterized protein n=1 Tax=Schistocephalus solidus TaxID=70667 RepID=A0A0X3PQ96_SCHSO
MDIFKMSCVFLTTFLCQFFELSFSVESDRTYSTKKVVSTHIYYIYTTVQQKRKSASSITISTRHSILSLIGRENEGQAHILTVINYEHSKFLSQSLPRNP